MQSICSLSLNLPALLYSDIRRPWVGVMKFSMVHVFGQKAADAMELTGVIESGQRSSR